MTYITISGDMWDSIAYKAMGSENYAHLLMAANIEYIDTVIFEAGIEVEIPDIPVEVSSSLPPWKQ